MDSRNPSLIWPNNSPGPMPFDHRSSAVAVQVTINEGEALHGPYRVEQPMARMRTE